MPVELTLEDVQRQVGAIVMELWRTGKTVTELQARVVALTPKPKQPAVPPKE